MSENKTDTRTATQRLDDLEKIAQALYNTVNELINANDKIAPLVADVPVMKQAIGLLNKRIEAVVSTANEASGITAEAVSAKMVEMNVVDLKDQIAGWLSTGALVPVDTIDDNSFVVAEEVDATGTVVNPRTQFPMSSQSSPDVRNALAGAKVGANITIGEDKLQLNILEIYSISEPGQESSTEAAPAAEVQNSEQSTTENTAAS